VSGCHEQVIDRSDLPAGPVSPAPHQAFSWFAQPYTMLDECAQAFGDRFTLNLPVMGTAVVVHDPADVKPVFAASPADLRVGPTAAYMRAVLGEDSLFLLDGEEHFRQRKMLLEGFRIPRLRAHGPMIQAVARELSAKWPVGRPFPMLAALLEVSLEVILRVSFGGELSSGRHRRIRAEIGRVLDAVSTSLAIAEAAASGTAPGPLGSSLETLEQLFEQECAVQRSVQGDSAGGALRVLITTLGRDGRPALSATQLRDQLLTVLLAGHETTAAAMAWTLILLNQYPAALTMLLGELRSLGPDRRPERVEALPFLDAVIKESLRVRPVVPIVSREAVRPVQMRDLRVPAGVRVSPCIYLAHRRPARFPDPGRFWPERFLGQRYAPSEYLPFGGGRRRCVGAALAVYQMKLVLAELLARFDFAPAFRRPVRPVRKGIIVAPSERAPFILQRSSTL
jgi:cytochrome P450 family 110